MQTRIMVEPWWLKAAATFTTTGLRKFCLHFELCILNYRAPYRRYSAGTTAMFRIVEVTSPHRMTMAIGV
jgi:hypothetical protein